MRLTTLIKTFGAVALMGASSAAVAQETTPVAIGDRIEGALTETDRRTGDGNLFDAYGLQATAGQRVKIAMTAIDGTTENTLDPLLRVGRVAADGFVELAMNDDDEGLNAGLVFTAVEAGDYVIHAEGLDGATGAYTLAVETGPALADSQRIAVGDTVRGALDEDDGVGTTGQRADLYRLSAEAGTRIAIEMRSTAFDTYLALIGDPDGQQTVVAEDDDGLGDGTDSRIEAVLAEAGDYLVEARSLSGDETGAYTLKIEAVAPPPPAQPLAIGVMVEGEIADGDPRADGIPYDAYGFSGDAGDRVQIVMRSGDFDTTVQIGAAGDEFTALATDDDGLGEGTDSRLIFALPEAGDYVVRALPLGADGRGLYSIELTDRGPKPVAGSIVVGATARGTLAEDDDVSAEGAYFDAYRLQAKAGDKLIVTMVSNAFDAFIDVGTQEGDDSAAFTSIKSDDDGLSDTHAKVEWTVEDDGAYLIRARGLSTGEVGAYALKVERDR